MKRQAAETKLPWLALDAGALFFPQPLMTEEHLEQAKKAAAGIAGSYGRMGFAVVNIAVHDLAAGIPFLRELEKNAATVFISANIKLADGSRPFHAAQVIDRAGLRLGVVGIADAARPVSFHKKSGINIVPWQEVLPQEVARLRSVADIVVLLSNANPQDNMEIARKVAGIDIIIQSGQAANNLGPRLDDRGDTILIQTASQGKYLGVLRLVWRGPGGWTARDTEQEYLKEKMREKDGIDWRIRRKERGKDKDELLRDAEYQRLVAERTRLASEISAGPRKAAEEKKPDTLIRSTFVGNFTALPLTVPEDPEVAAIVDKTAKAINVRPQRPAASSTLPAHLVGWHVCSSCHPAQTAFWQQTRHAGAYRTLAAKGKEATLACLPCHVTNPLPKRPEDIRPENSRLLDFSDSLRGVGCEACHGPGQRHARALSVQAITRRPEEKICLSCHAPGHDDSFNYDKKTPLIACPPR